MRVFSTLSSRTELAEQVAQQGQSPLRFLPAPAEHHEVVGVTHQHTPALRLPCPVQPVQVDVGKQRGHHPALRRARDAVLDGP